MSSVRCPYDDYFCAEKEKRLEEWERSVAYHAQHCINNVIHTSADMFEGCPRDVFWRNTTREDCGRYQQYLNIVRKIKANEEQR